MSWDTALYSFANDCVAKSWKSWEEKNYGESWGYSFTARLAFVANLVIDVALFPFAIIGVTFGLLHALGTRNHRSAVFQKTRNFIIEKTNHALLSIFGAVVSPAIAHRFQYANLAPFVIAARITVISAGFLYYFLGR